MTDTGCGPGTIGPACSTLPDARPDIYQLEDTGWSTCKFCGTNFSTPSVVGLAGVLMDSHWDELGGAGAPRGDRAKAIMDGGTYFTWFVPTGAQVHASVSAWFWNPCADGHKTQMAVAWDVQPGQPPVIGP